MSNYLSLCGHHRSDSLVYSGLGKTLQHWVQIPSEHNIYALLFFGAYSLILPILKLKRMEIKQKEAVVLMGRKIKLASNFQPEVSSRYRKAADLPSCRWPTIRNAKKSIKIIRLIRWIHQIRSTFLARIRLSHFRFRIQLLPWFPVLQVLLTQAVPSCDLVALATMRFLHFS